MKNSNLYIPFMPPLSLASLMPYKKDCVASFPFTSERAQYYYLARNALWHGIDILGLKPGDGILMPAYTHGVEVETLLSKKLRLTYYRIDENMEPDINHLESLLSPSIRALYVIHYLGFPQPIEALKSLAVKHGIILIEDCALSLFSRIPSGPLGTFGDISIFCIYKTLPVPHGGLLVLNKPGLTLPSSPERPNLASTASYLINRLIESLYLKWDGIGYKIGSTVKEMGRVAKRWTTSESIPIDTNQFDEGLVNLGMSRITTYLINRLNMDEVVRKKRENYIYMVNALDGQVMMPFNDLPEGVCPLSFPIFVHDKPSIQSMLQNDGIETVNFWSIRNPDKPDIFPEVRFLRSHLLEVPIHQGLSEKHLKYMAIKLKEKAKW